MTHIYTCEEQREDVVNQIRCAGKSLIANAESMVGKEEVLDDFYITINFCINPQTDEFGPRINISKTVMPDTYLEYLRNKIHEQEFDK